MTIDVKTILEKATEIRLKMEKDLQTSMNQIFAEFWESNPGINAVVWTQYSPYFMDGDPCEFSVNDPSFTNAKGDDLDENIKSISWGEYDGDNEEVFTIQSWSSPDTVLVGVNLTDIKELSSMICSSEMDNVLRSAFGDDSLVIATREGFTIQDYSENHD